MRKLVLILVIACASLAALTLLLPESWTVARTITIEEPAKTIRPFLESPTKWEEWSPWTAERDASLRFEYAGPVAGPGAIQRWTSNQSGAGRLEMVAVEDARIEYSLYNAGDELHAQGAFRLRAVPGGTELTWQLRGEVGASIAGRFMTLMVDKMLGPDFETGLSKLKSVVEGLPEPTARKENH